jgi:hypothetical protein
MKRQAILQTIYDFRWNIALLAAGLSVPAVQTIEWLNRNGLAIIGKCVDRINQTSACWFGQSLIYSFFNPLAWPFIGITFFLIGTIIGLTCKILAKCFASPPSAEGDDVSQFSFGDTLVLFIVLLVLLFMGRIYLS